MVAVGGRWSLLAASSTPGPEERGGAFPGTVMGVVDFGLDLAAAAGRVVSVETCKVVLMVPIEALLVVRTARGGITPDDWEDAALSNALTLSFILVVLVSVVLLGGVERFEGETSAGALFVRLGAEGSVFLTSVEPVGVEVVVGREDAGITVLVARVRVELEVWLWLVLGFAEAGVGTLEPTGGALAVFALDLAASTVY